MNSKFSYLRDGAQKYCGTVDNGVTFTVENQLNDKELWKKFVEVFATNADVCDKGWRGEYF